MPRRGLLAAVVCAVVSITGAAHQPQAAKGSLDQPADERNQTFGKLLVQRAYLGVELGELTEAKSKELKVDGAKGALVERVLPGTPADTAGLKTDDVVVAIDGKQVATGAELREALGAHAAGDTVSLEVLRAGTRMTFSATLSGRFGDRAFWHSQNGLPFYRGGLPEGFELGGPGVFALSSAPRLGVAVLPMTDELRDYFGVEHGKGVLVSAVSKGSAAATAGIRAGDVLVAVDGEAVARAGDIARALSAKGSEAPRTVSVELVRERSRMTVSATVEAPRMMNEE